MGAFIHSAWPATWGCSVAYKRTWPTVPTPHPPPPSSYTHLGSS